jgi:putative addiction module killer protein
MVYREIRLARKKKEDSPSEPVDGQTEARTVNWNVLVLITDEEKCPFDEWYDGLRDRAAKARIAARLTRILLSGNFGDHRERISGAISELKIDYGPGYRLYYARVGDLIIVLVAGGTKDSQASDIERANTLWERYKDEIEKRTREFPR